LGRRGETRKKSKVVDGRIAKSNFEEHSSSRRERGKGRKSGPEWERKENS